MADARIGCSGFLYDDWRGPFYPEGTPRSRWLNYYCTQFSTVELNVTFYRLPERETFAKWYGATPEGFVFSLKGSRFITHVKKLKDCEEPIEAFYSRASVLKEKLGAVLWQLPPTFNQDADRLKEFLAALRPHGTRSAFEFRNKSWINKKIFTLLQKEGAAICMADHPDFLNSVPATTDFIYIRRHGIGGNYASSYEVESLKKDAKFVKAHLRKKMDVYMYFNNDANGYAPANALELISLLGGKKS